MSRNALKTAQLERLSFAKRLESALVAVGMSVSATVVQREFNARSRQRPITAHAARKWLMGESIPTQERLRILAAWLGVSASWLRLGDTPVIQEPSALSANEQLLIKNYRKLSALQRRQLLALIGTMAGKRAK